MGNNYEEGRRTLQKSRNKKPYRGRVKLVGRGKKCFARVSVGRPFLERRRSLETRGGVGGGGGGTETCSPVRGKERRVDAYSCLKGVLKAGRGGGKVRRKERRLFFKAQPKETGPGGSKPGVTGEHVWRQKRRSSRDFRRGKKKTRGVARGEKR